MPNFKSLQKSTTKRFKLLLCTEIDTTLGQQLCCVDATQKELGLLPDKTKKMKRRKQV
jgi:hypothetical protein